MFFGDFSDSLNIDGVEIQYRGLSVSEYNSMMRKMGDDGLTASLQIQLINTCVLEVDGILTEDGDTVRLVSSEDLEDLGEYIDQEYVTSLAERIWMFTIMTEEEMSMVRGHLRFMMGLSDLSDTERQSWDCKRCLELKKDSLRLCGLSNQRREALTGVQDQPTQEPAKELTRAYGRRKQHIQQREVEVAERPKSFGFGGFQFPQCPVSWVPIFMKELIEQGYFAIKHNMYHYGNNLGQMPYKIYTIDRIVASESSVIESEQMESANKKASSKRNR